MSSEDAAHAERVEKLRFYRSEIKHEFSLLSGRLSAYIASQSFLLVPFALSITNMEPDWGARALFPPALAAIGLATSIQALPGISAARETIRLWRDQQNRLFREDPELADYRVHGPIETDAGEPGPDLLHERSLVFARWSPWIFLSAWCLFGLLGIGLASGLVT